ncbi:MAG: chemotaxis response regulator protein-glutamate methylesterase [Pseudomonadales bacterium]|nr:chemotaxis response regulator protein-glutamate methylesterase [Pseudomonadales bacterium]
MKKIKVLIVDDSALIRQMLSSAMALADDIDVIGMAEDAFVAREMIKDLNPDVLTLDVEMPKMDGISFLANLMRLRPMPVVMISTLTTKSSDVTLKALELGAVDYVAKPSADLQGDIKGFAKEVQQKIRTAAKANVHQLVIPDANKNYAKVKKAPLAKIANLIVDHIVAIGASTGGTEAIKEVLMGLPASCPPIVVAQHIPANFSASFAKRLNELCPMRVVEAENNQLVTAGTVYLAPGDYHLTLVGADGKFHCKLDGKPKVNRHRPSVDVLFESVLTRTQGKLIGVLLTGMGADGAKGLLHMQEAGCYTIIQDEASSVVWGMPGAAFKMGAAEDVLGLTHIAPKLMKLPTTYLRRVRSARQATGN